MATNPPGGYATYDGAPVARGRPATQVGVFRYFPPGRIEPMPWLRVLAVEYEQEGGEPRVAQLRYRFADPTDREPETITGPEQVYSLDATGPGVARVDDRIVVAELREDGTLDPVFDGYCQAPSLTYAENGNGATITAVSVEVRAYDVPLSGSIWRDSSNPAEGEDVETDIPLTFNRMKDGSSESTMLRDPARWPETDRGLAYPVFFEPTTRYDPPDTPEENRTVDIWYLHQAVRYCCAVGNPDEEFVRNPTGESIDRVLKAIVPKGGDGAGYFDPTDPGTFDEKPIPVPTEKELDGQHWPEAIRSLIEPHGFGLCFRTEVDDSGETVHRLDIYRKVDSSVGVVQDLLLQPRGFVLDPSRSDVAEAQLMRDSSGLANQFRVLTGPVEYEVGVVLWPMFEVSAGDAATPARFRANDPGFTGDAVHKYRRFGLDEAGEGHWDGTAIDTSPADLTAIFADDAFGETTFVVRRRAPGKLLFSLDATGDRRVAELWVSTDYKGKGGVWDGTGTWQKYQGNWELLDDMIGVRLTTPDISDVNIGKPPPSSATTKYPFSSGKVNVLRSHAAPEAANPRFWFRLTCTIEGDRDLRVYALRRPASPTKFVVERQDRARSQFVKQVIAKSSHLGDGKADKVSRDDTDRAQQYADARRLAHEFGPTAGTVRVPRLTSRYRVGDRIRAIAGVGLSLATNVGAGSGEGPAYPSVVKVTRRYDQQATEIQLSDRRGEPRRGRW